jgi:hypothetical protein
LAVAQCNGNGALGSPLAYDVFIELRDNLARRQLVERQLLFFGGCG